MSGHRKARGRRAQRRVQALGKGREPRQQGAGLVVVMELEDVSDPAYAQSLLSYMGLPPAPMLVAEDRPPLAVLASPGAVDDCVFVADGDRILGVLHGTDCELSTYIRNHVGSPQIDMSQGKCARRAAGGVFRVLDVAELAR
jgi:hypothetical protein